MVTFDASDGLFELPLTTEGRTFARDNLYEIAYTIPAKSFPPYAVKGEFSVSGEKKVYFSNSLLRFYYYNATNQYWSMSPASSSQTNSYSTNETISPDGLTVNDGQGYRTLYGWSSGENDHYGLMANPDASAYAGSFADWGTENHEIQASTSSSLLPTGGDDAHPLHWRTLSAEEWSYLLFTRPASTVNGVANARFAKATYVYKVNNEGVRKQLLMIFPDN